MTTVQSMLTRCAAAAFSPLLALAVTACAPKPDLLPPTVLVSPYDSRAGNVVWAVAPLANESGTSAVDTLAVSDALVGQVTEVPGMAGIPMNRTVAVMRQLDMPAVRSSGDARRLAAALGVDGILVGSVTAYDPYNPPTIGLILGLYFRATLGPGTAADPGTLRGAYSDRNSSTPRTAFSDTPASLVAEQLSGANHGVQMNLKEYAQGRHDVDAALGWRRYLASMDLYTNFAANRVVRGLLDQERLRLARDGAAATTPPR